MEIETEKEICFKIWFTGLQSDKPRVCTVNLKIVFLGKSSCFHPRPKAIANRSPSSCSDISLTAK